MIDDDVPAVARDLTARHLLVLLHPDADSPDQGGATSGVSGLTDFVPLGSESSAVLRLAAGVPTLLATSDLERRRGLEPAGTVPALGSIPLLRPHDGERLRTADSPLRTPDHVAVVRLDDIADDTPSARLSRQDAELDRLAALAALGDRAALGQLLGMVQPHVVRYCRARLGSRGVGLQMAEDVAQDVLLSLCGALARYQGGKTRLMAFVYGISSNKVVDAFRAGGRDYSEPTEGLPDTADSAPGPESAVLLRAQVDELSTLLDLIPAEQREILVMRIAMQLSAEQTARIIGSTAGAVRVTQHRALAKLRGLVAAERLVTSPRFSL